MIKPIKKLAAVLAVAAVGLTLLAACGKNEPPEKIENTQQEIVLPDDVIRTPAGELNYPGMWTDRVTHKVIEEGDDWKVIFRSDLGKVQEQLFTLCFGTVPEDGFVLGYLAQDGEEIPVSVVMAQIDQTINEAETLNALQESVNDLLVQVYEHPDFVAAG